MNKTAYLVLLLAAVFGGLLLYLSFGYSEKGNITVRDTNPKPDIYLTFYGFKSGEKEVEEIEKILHRFMEQNPGIVVSYEGCIAEQYLDNLLKRLESGNSDDIFMIHPSAMVSLAARGWLGSKVMDLQHLPLVDQYSPLVKKWIRVNGQIPAVPMTMNVVGLLVNVDVLKACGIKSIPQTYGAWLEAMHKIKAQGYTPLLRYADGDDNLMFFVISRAFARLLYGEVAQPTEWTTKTLFREALIDARDDILPLGAPVYDSYKKAAENFAQGDAAFLIAPSWALLYFKAGEPKFDYRYVGLPLSDKGPIVDARASIPVGISAESPNREAALKFLEFMIQPQYIEQYSADQNTLSPLAGASLNNPLYTHVMRLVDEGKVFSDVSPEIPFNALGALNPLVRELSAGKDVDELF